MSGNQFGFNYNNQFQVGWLFDIVKSRIASTFDVYNLTNDDIVYIQVSFIKLDVKLLAGLTLDRNTIVKNSITDREVDTIITTTNIPISTDQSSLSTPLKITFVDNTITSIYVTINNETFN